MHVLQTGERFTFLQWIAYHHTNLILAALNALSFVAKKTALDLPANHSTGESSLKGIWLEGGADFFFGALKAVVDVKNTLVGIKLGLDVSRYIGEHTGGLLTGV